MAWNAAIFLIKILGNYQNPSNYRANSVDSFNRRVAIDEEWSATLSIATVCITLGISMGVALYYPSMEIYAIIISFRIVMNTVGGVYLFKLGLIFF